MMKRLLALAGLLLASTSLHAQSLVVTTCGTLPSPYTAGLLANQTVDVNGIACTNGAGGGGSTTLTVGTTPTSGGGAGQLMFDTGTVLQESPSLTFSSTGPELFLYNVTGTNYEAGVLHWNTNVLLVGTEKGGTGVARNMEFLIGGVNKLDYGVTVAGTWNAPGQIFNSTQFAVGNPVSSTVASFQGIDGTKGALNLGLSSYIGWQTGNVLTGTVDTTISRNAPGVVQFGSGSTPNAAGSILSASHTLAAGTTTVNQSGLNVTQTWNAPAIATTAASGSAGTATISFASQPAAYPVGSTVVVAGVTPSGYNGTFVVTASTTTSVSYANATTGAQTVAGTVQQLFDAPILINVTNTASRAESLVQDWQVGGSSILQLRSNGWLLWNSGGLAGFDPTFNVGGSQPGLLYGGPISYYVGFGSNIKTSNTGNPSRGNGVELSTGGVLAWSSVSAPTNNADVFLARDGNGILAQRDGTLQAQNHRVYNTYTDASNGEWGEFNWQSVANTLVIGTNKNGTGSTRSLEFIVGGTNQMDYGVTNGASWTISGGGGAFWVPNGYITTSQGLTATNSAGVINFSGDTYLSRGSANVLKANTAGASDGNGSFLARSYQSGGTAPTNGGGACTASSIAGGASAGKFTTTTGCSSNSVILTLGVTAPTGWACVATDQTTTTNSLKQSANTTTSVTLTGTTTGNDVIYYHCLAF